MNLPPIQSDDEYQALLAEAGNLVAMDPDVGSAEGERLMALVEVIEEWERIHYPMSRAQND